MNRYSAELISKGFDALAEGINKRAYNKWKQEEKRRDELRADMIRQQDREYQIGRDTAQSEAAANRITLQAELDAKARQPQEAFIRKLEAGGFVTQALTTDPITGEQRTVWIDTNTSAEPTRQAIIEYTKAANAGLNNSQFIEAETAKLGGGGVDTALNKNQSKDVARQAIPQKPFSIGDVGGAVGGVANTLWNAPGRAITGAVRGIGDFFGGGPQGAANLNEASAITQQSVGSMTPEMLANYQANMANAPKERGLFDFMQDRNAAISRDISDNIKNWENTQKMKLYMLGKYPEAFRQAQQLPRQ